MEINKSENTNIANYEILIRKRDNNHFACYCPQINVMVKGKKYDWVKTAMKDKILEHIKSLQPKEVNEDEN